MTNREKYAEQILDIVCSGFGFAMNEKAIICPCACLSCIECKFCKGDCDERKREWANSEYIEKPGGGVMSEKTKVTSMDIVLRIIGGKPYYSLKYKEVGNNYYNVGYSSYLLENVIKWRYEYFEIVKGNETDDWIPVKERMPEEHDSIFAKFKGTPNWTPNMFEKTSKHVLVTVKYKDGTVLTKEAHTIDGKWKAGTSAAGGKVIAWMPFPEPYKEG